MPRRGRLSHPRRSRELPEKHFRGALRGLSHFALGFRKCLPPAVA